jgi:hypothetical protein
MHQIILENNFMFSKSSFLSYLFFFIDTMIIVLIILLKNKTQFKINTDYVNIFYNITIILVYLT